MNTRKTVVLGCRTAMAALLVVATQAHADGVTVTDALQRVVSFERPPQRIVVTGKASFMIEHALYLFPEVRQLPVDFLGGQFSQRLGADDFLALVAPGHAASATLSGEAGIEQIAAIRPEVVLLKSSARRTGETLDQVGIPYVFLDFEAPAHYERDLAILGRILEAPDRAQALISYYQGLVATVQNELADQPVAGKPRTLLLQYTDRGGTSAFSVPPPDWIQTELVERAGGIPLWKDTAQRGGWTTVNLEQIAAWNPDLVFLVRYRDRADQAVADLMADTRWQALRAVRTGRVFAVPGDFCSWDQPDPRWGLGLLWMAMRTHPDLFASVDLTREIYRFYALYGLDEASVRTRVMPLIHERLTHGPE